MGRFVIKQPPLAEDPVLVVLALTIIAFTASGLLISLFVSIPYALRRLRRYPKRGSAYRLFAQFALLNTVMLACCLFFFLAAGTVSLAIGNDVARIVMVRTLLVGAIVLLSVLVALVPIGHSYTEAAANRERRELIEKTKREGENGGNGC